MKNKLKIIIPIAIAVIAIMIAAFVIRFDGGDSVDIRSMMSTAQKYLVENNFEQAIMEYEAVINLEPNNAEAYLGIAEAYLGMGDIDKAIEWLEKGYALTGDEQLKNMIDELTDSVNADLSDTSESSATTAETAETEETTSAEPVLTEKQLEYCDGWYSVFSYDENENIVSMVLYNKSGEERMNAEYEYSGDNVHRKVYVDGVLYNVSDVTFTDIMAEMESEKKKRANTTDRREFDHDDGHIINEFVYDENGELSEKRNIHIREDDHGGYTTTYLKNGKVYKVWMKSSFDEVTFYYDERGYLIRREYSDGYTDRFTYQYDDNGYPVKKIVGDEIKYYNFYSGDRFVGAIENSEINGHSTDVYSNGNANEGRDGVFNECNKKGMYLRMIDHNDYWCACIYYIPSSDESKIIDKIEITDDRKILFGCPYCYNEEN